MPGSKGRGGARVACAMSSPPVARREQAPDSHKKRPEAIGTTTYPMMRCSGGRSSACACALSYPSGARATVRLHGQLAIQLPHPGRHDNCCAYSASQRGSCRPGLASPIARAGTVAVRPKPRSFSPAVPSACHSEHDPSGSPRSATDTPDRLTWAPSTTGARQHDTRHLPPASATPVQESASQGCGSGQSVMAQRYVITHSCCQAGPASR